MAPDKPPRHERRDHFRGRPSALDGLAVTFRAQGHSGWVEAAIRDLGDGGAFLVSTLLQAVGTELDLRLTLPSSEQVFTVAAIVRWASVDADGMGVEFVGIDATVRRELADYFASLLGP